MPNYWLGIMAVVLAITLATWIGLVFRADKHQSGQTQEAAPKREVIGGMFAARKGGRQVMPDPDEPIAHDDWSDQESDQDVVPSVPEQAGAPGQTRPAAAGTAAQPAVPGPRGEPESRRADRAGPAASGQPS